MSSEIKQLQNRVTVLENTLGTLISWLERELGRVNAVTLLTNLHESTESNKPKVNLFMENDNAKS